MNDDGGPGGPVRRQGGKSMSQMRFLLELRVHRWRIKVRLWLTRA